MRCLIVWMVAGLILIALLLLGLSSISLAEEGKWTRKADMPTARAVLSTSVVNGKIYAIGGSHPWPVAISTVEEYDPAKNKWTRKAEMPARRWGFSISAVNGKIYVIGGGLLGPGDILTSIVEEYDTGFAGEFIDAKGKLATSWGKLKARD